MARTALPLALAALAPLAPLAAAQRDDGPQRHASFEQGTYPTIYEQPADVVLDDLLVHTDQVGGAVQGLVELRGAPGGYAGIWTDHRHGNLGLYVGLLDEAGDPVRPEQPVHPPVTARQLDPSLGFSEGHLGGVAWHLNQGQKSGVHVRFFDVDDFTNEGPQPVGPPSMGGGGRGGGRDGDDGGAGTGGGVRPACLMTEDGGWAARVEAGKLELLAFTRRNGRMVSSESFVVLNPDGPPATGAPALSLGAGGELLCAWSGPDGVVTVVRTADGVTAPQAVGPGTVEKLLTAGGGGWWMHAVDDTGPHVRRLAADGIAQGAPIRPVEKAVVSFDVAGFGSGLAVLAELPEPSPVDPSQGRRIELHLLRPDGSALFPEPQTALFGGAAVQVRTPRIASTGPFADELLLAWTDHRAGNPDVYYKKISPTDLAPEARRWNTDELSSDQQNVEIASNGESAVLVWDDTRHKGVRQIYTRLISPVGAFPKEDVQAGFGQGDDVALRDLRDGRFPAVAMASDGTFVVTWHLELDLGHEVVAQRFSSWGQPLNLPVRLDAGNPSTSMFAPAITALSFDRGFAVAFVRRGAGPMVARLKPDGTLHEAAAPLSTRREPRAGRPAITSLDDGRLFAAWDQPGEPVKFALAGRFLDENAAPIGEVVALPQTPGGDGDLDPALAPGPDGGFVMTWTGNEAPARDAVAGVFDRTGQPVSGLLWVSVKANEQDFADICRLADGSWALAWEEDISGQDHVCVRRLTPENDWTLGPRVTLNQRPAAFVEARTAGVLAPLGDGLAGAWVDRRRAQGMDVYARVLGPGFDAP